MKQKLLFTFLLSSFLSFAQAPIGQFVNGVQTEYAIVESSTTIDESTTGAGLTWNFTNLSQVGTNTDTNAAPTAGEISDYPGTTEVLTVTSAGMPPVVSKLFISNQAGLVSITGANQGGGQLTLNITDNATLGTFPLSFNYTNTDTVSGDFDASVNGTAANGTFTGNFNTEVDAYGTLNFNDFGLGAYSGNVTRLKTELSINLVVLGFINIGTVDQTNYYYYDDMDGSLVFRSSTNVIDIDAFGNVFMDTIVLYEAQDRSTLSLDNSNLASTDIKIYPNPAQHILNITTSDLITVNSIKAIDLNGRTVLDVKDSTNAIDVSNLESGLYMLNIETTNGSLTKRFIKK